MLINIFSILIIFITHATFSSDSQIDTKEDDRLRNDCIAFGDACNFKNLIPCCIESNICRTVKWLHNQTRSICITPALIGDYCRYDTDCLRLDYAKCNTDYQECDCIPNYGVLTNNAKCVALIGGYCDEYKPCMVYNSICIDNECQCRDRFIMKSNTECLPASIGGFCQHDTDCLRLDYAYCDKEFHQCECLPNYGKVKNIPRCVSLLGGHCYNQEDCFVDNSICIDHKCQCEVQFTIKSNRECWPTSIGKSCKRDLDCSDILHVGCSVSKKCVCKDNHILVDNSMCVPLLDEFCWSDELCAPINSVCFNNKCKCKPNYSAVANTHCFKFYIGRPCDSNQDCRNILDSVCSEHGLCICDNNYAVGYKNNCVPIIGGVCLNDTECRVKNSVCVNNKCQCSTNYEPINDNTCIFV